MEPTDVTIEILKSIRDEIRVVAGQTHEVAKRTEEVATEVRRLERRQVETEMRLATELVAVAGAVNGLREDLREDRALRAKVDDHEKRIEAIETRIG